MSNFNDKSKWIWMPHAAHFILGHKCQFHLATCVGKHIVSTVGELWNERRVREIHAEVCDPKWLNENIHLKGEIFDSAYFKKFGFEDIGHERKYETMVFESIKSKNKCCPFKIIVGNQVDYTPYNDSGFAYKGHLKLCNKWSKK